MRVAGIMSGTSLDGIDVAIVDIRGRGWMKRVTPVAFHTRAYPNSVRQALLGVSNCETHTRDIARLHFLLGELYAEALIETCRRSKTPLASVELIGCHGQTIFHEGSPIRFHGHRVASTLQIGEAAILSERTGCPVISDFRPRDIAAGGRGAPLVPYVDYLLFRHRTRGRVALNIGGIANITAIPPAAGPGDVFAFDTGPGNMVMDALVWLHTGGKQSFDRGGRIASRGATNPQLLDDLTKDAYYRRRPPKSAGREQYGTAFIERLMATGLPMPDLIATATELTAATIAAALRRFVEKRTPVDDLIVSGGGLHNPVLQRHLARLLPGVTLHSSADFGVDPDAKEAIAFAILAHESWHQAPANLPSATGARHAVILGKLQR